MATSQKPLSAGTQYPSASFRLLVCWLAWLLNKPGKPYRGWALEAADIAVEFCFCMIIFALAAALALQWTILLALRVLG